MDMLKLCDKCRKGEEETFYGYIGWVDNSCYECPICGDKMIDTILTVDEYNIIDNISEDISFLEAMIDLKQKDPIEYQLKMSQFKANLSQQESAKQVVEQKSNVPHCPTCSSTDLKKISTTSKVMNTAMWGIFGTKRHKTYHCNSCGYEW